MGDHERLASEIDLMFFVFFLLLCCLCSRHSHSRSPGYILRPFLQVENVDFSEPVIAEMRRTHSGARPRMTWRVMDVTDMSG